MFPGDKSSVNTIAKLRRANDGCRLDVEKASLGVGSEWLERISCTALKPSKNIIINKSVVWRFIFILLSGEKNKNEINQFDCSPSLTTCILGVVYRARDQSGESHKYYAGMIVFPVIVKYELGLEQSRQETPRHIAHVSQIMKRVRFLEENRKISTQFQFQRVGLRALTAPLALKRWQMLLPSTSWWGKSDEGGIKLGEMYFLKTSLFKKSQ